MNIRLLLILSGFLICFLCCKKTGFTPPQVTALNVVTTIAGHVQYPLFQQPLKGVKVVAYASKFLYYNANHYPVYRYYAMDSVYTDSSGNFSMTFDRDSSACTYSLGSPAGLADTQLVFPAGDSTWMLLDLYRDVSVKLVMPLQHSDSCMLFFYQNDTLGQWFMANYGADTLFDSLHFREDSSYRLCIRCDKNHVVTAHTYDFYISSYDDTATRYLIVDPSTF